MILLSARERNVSPGFPVLWEEIGIGEGEFSGLNPKITAKSETLFCLFLFCLRLRFGHFSIAAAGFSCEATADF